MIQINTKYTCAIYVYSFMQAILHATSTQNTLAKTIPHLHYSKNSVSA